jgi:hypothetical protein
MAGYELITTASRERSSSAVGATAWRARLMTGPPPRPGPITHTAKPVARSPTDLARDLSYGHGIGLVYVLAAVRVVLIRLPARAGTRPGSTRGQHHAAVPLRSHQHHQQHGPDAPDQLERHETPDPLRPGAVEARFQCVRQASRSGPMVLQERPGIGGSRRTGLLGRAVVRREPSRRWYGESRAGGGTGRGGRRAVAQGEAGRRAV